MLFFTTGNTIDSSIAALGATMQSKLRDDIEAHPGWQVVEEFTPATGLVNWVVLKCLASSSGLAADYYVILGRVISNGSLYHALCEDYDPVTKIVSHYVPYQAGSTFNYDSIGRSPHTYTLSTTVPPVTGTINSPWFLRWIPADVSVKWWLIVSEDGFTWAWNNTGNEGYFSVNKFIPLSLSYQSDFPVIMSRYISGGSGPDGGITRNLAAAGLASGDPRGLCCYGGASTFPNYSFLIGVSGLDMRHVDKLNDNKRLLNHVAILMYFPTGPTTNSDKFGIFVGKQNPDRLLFGNINPPTGLLWGDSFAINGTLWVQYLPTDGRLFNTGVAAP